MQEEVGAITVYPYCSWLEWGKLMLGMQNKGPILIDHEIGIEATDVYQWVGLRDLYRLRNLP